MKTTPLLVLMIAAFSVIFFPPATLAVSDETEMFPFGSSWTWLHPQNGVDPGASQPGFQANWMKASWPDFTNSGAGILGYGGFDWGAFATDIGTPPSSQRYTAYFKRHFTLSSNASGFFFANLLCDDGCVIYVDGVRVGEWNYTGPDSYTGLAALADESREAWVQLSIPGGNLAAGTHTIAVSVHNNQSVSSDLAFDLRLIKATGAANAQISKPEFGSSYQVLWFPTKPTWDEAQTIAVQAGGRLPAIESQAENQFLIGLLSPDRFWVRRHGIGAVPVVTYYEGPWVGAYQPTGSVEPAVGWVWVDGTSALNAPWRSAQPDNNGGAENWAHYWGINQKEATLNDTGFAVQGLSNPVIVEFPATPVITGVLPNPVPGSNSSHPFTISGANFNPNCAVTLRDTRTGEVFPNRAKSSQTINSIVLNPNFTTAASTWTVEVINPGEVSSGQYSFPVGAAVTLTSVTVTGARSLAGGASTDYTAIAHYSDSHTQDVSNSAAWSFSGGPAGTAMSGRTLHAGSGPSAAVHVQATFSDAHGSRTGNVDVSIGTGLSVFRDSASIAYLSGSGTSLTYQLQATAISNGGAGTITASWMLDGTAVGTGTALVLNTIVLASPTNHILKVTANDATGQTAQATFDLLFPKPAQPNEQYPKIGATLPNPGTLFAADAVNGYDADSEPPASNGLVVIIHGMDSKVTDKQGKDANEPDNWMMNMADAITAKLGANPPRIILYDWSKDADTLKIAPQLFATALNDFKKDFYSPTANDSFAKTLGIAAAEIRDGASISAVGLGWVPLTLGKLYVLRGKGETHGGALADYIREEILGGRIIPTAPIHLIGHSAGGFVALNCGQSILNNKALIDAVKVPTNLRVTTLDTPILKADLIQSVRGKGGKFERYVSSIGWYTPDLVRFDDYPAMEAALSNSNAGNSQMASVFFIINKPSYKQILTTPKPPFAEAGNYHYGYDIEATGLNFVTRHQHVHQWYIHTIQNSPNSFTDGFYYSPFPGGHPFPGSPSAAPPSLAALGGAPASPPPLVLSGFSTFGSVVESAGAYTLTEQGNAGIYQSVTLPMNASTVKVRVQFTQPGDGDFIEVSFGDHLSLVVIADGAIVRSEPVEVEFPVVVYGGETGQLLFKLTGVNADNAVAVIDNISITTDDDADGDGLTFAQETALGTDPRYSDTDADGLSDADEVNVYFTNPLLADTDGDGLSDAAEVQAGTNPLSPASRLAVDSLIRNANGTVSLAWRGVAGKTYTVIRSQTVDFANFDIAATGVIGVAPQTSLTDSTVPIGTPTMFYVVLVE